MRTGKASGMKMSVPGRIREELKAAADSQKAFHYQEFFKTGPGEYGEGDVFHGVRVPYIREISKKYLHIPFEDIREVINSRFHEERYLALLILISRFSKKKTEDNEKERIFSFYLNERKNINNWDLVDISAPRIPGQWLFDRDREIIYDLAVSRSLWDRRISVLSTFYFIRQNEFTDTMKISEILIGDREDLIHKAVGWMLREVGKRDRTLLESFLSRHSTKMPRTMLRYSIEKFSRDVRQKYLKKPQAGKA